MTPGNTSSSSNPRTSPACFATKWYSDHELAIRMLFYTGMREGEMLGLRWEDVDWPRHLIDLRRTVAFRQHRLIINAPKSGELRTIDVPAALTASLRELHSIRQAQAVVEGAAASPWIFRAGRDPAKSMNDAWFRDRVWRPLLEKAEVRHIRVHDARHTYASLMLRRGMPIAYVSKQLGHSSIQVTVDLYGHFIPGADRHHVEGPAEAIEEAGRQLAATQPQPNLAGKTPTSPQVRAGVGAPGVIRSVMYRVVGPLAAGAEDPPSPTHIPRRPPPATAAKARPGTTGWQTCLPRCKPTIGFVLASTQGVQGAQGASRCSSPSHRPP
jgi:Phage integrase family